MGLLGCADGHDRKRLRMAARHRNRQRSRIVVMVQCRRMCHRFSRHSECESDRYVTLGTYWVRSTAAGTWTKAVFSRPCCQKCRPNGNSTALVAVVDSGTNGRGGPSPTGHRKAELSVGLEPVGPAIGDGEMGGDEKGRSGITARCSGAKCPADCCRNDQDFAANESWRLSMGIGNVHMQKPNPTQNCSGSRVEVTANGKLCHQRSQCRHRSGYHKIRGLR